MAGVSPGIIPCTDSSLENYEVVENQNHKFSVKDFSDHEITFNLGEKKLKNIKTKNQCIFKQLDRNIQKKKSITNHKWFTKLAAGKEKNIHYQTDLEKDKQYGVYTATCTEISDPKISQGGDLIKPITQDSGDEGIASEENGKYIQNSPLDMNEGRLTDYSSYEEEDGEHDESFDNHTVHPYTNEFECMSPHLASIKSILGKENPKNTSDESNIKQLKSWGEDTNASLTEIHREEKNKLMSDAAWYNISCPVMKFLLEYVMIVQLKQQSS